MCEPTTLLAISTAISVAGSVAGHIGQQQQAKAQTNAVRAGYNSQVSQLVEQRRQQNVQAQTEMSERGKQAMIERARLRAASAEGGVGGNSIDRIMGENEFNLGQDLSMMTENARNVNRQSSMEGMAMQAQAQSRLNQIERPSLLNTGLQIAGIGVSAGQQYSKTRTTKLP